VKRKRTEARPPGNLGPEQPGRTGGGAAFADRQVCQSGPLIDACEPLGPCASSRTTINAAGDPGQGTASRDHDEALFSSFASTASTDTGGCADGEENERNDGRAGGLAGSRGPGGFERIAPRHYRIDTPGRRRADDFQERRVQSGNGRSEARRPTSKANARPTVEVPAGHHQQRHEGRQKPSAHTAPVRPRKHGARAPSCWRWQGGPAGPHVAAPRLREAATRSRGMTRSPPSSGHRPAGPSLGGRPVHVVEQVEGVNHAHHPRATSGSGPGLHRRADPNPGPRFQISRAGNNPFKHKFGSHRRTGARAGSSIGPINQRTRTGRDAQTARCAEPVAGAGKRGATGKAQASPQSRRDRGWGLKMPLVRRPAGRRNLQAIGQGGLGRAWRRRRLPAADQKADARSLWQLSTSTSLG